MFDFSEQLNFPTYAMLEASANATGNDSVTNNPLDVLRAKDSFQVSICYYL